MAIIFVNTYDAINLMKTCLKLLLLFFCTSAPALCFSQIADLTALTPNPEKEQKFSAYVEWKHGGKEHFAEWKNANTLLYYKEIWYYAESFYVKRNELNQGVTLDESIIDISRYENLRKENEEAVVLLTGFKDALVLLPISKLIYKPAGN